MIQKLKNNIELVRERISSACARSSRDSGDVTLVAVTKYIDTQLAQNLVLAGMNDLGENRVQELIAKSEVLPKSVRWHMIGHLQRNKVKKAIELASFIHSVDSIRLTEAINSAASATEPVDILFEVNVSGELSKQGFDPNELNRAVEFALSCSNVRLCGFMTMAPIVEDAEHARKYFTALRELRDGIARKYNMPTSFRHLSMGMSADFEVAVEEGATLVRVGSLLYEGIL